MNDIKLAMLGSKEAAKRLTEAGVLVPCPMCGKTGVLHSWNTRAPILSAEEMEMLEGMK